MRVIRHFRSQITLDIPGESPTASFTVGSNGVLSLEETDTGSILIHRGGRPSILIMNAGYGLIETQVPIPQPAPAPTPQPAPAPAPAPTPPLTSEAKKAKPKK